ncbi:MAG: ABC transporter permease [Oscillospiraceae bacterium]|nr:ABC transporter permease [Oscillospiraceae bacterium]
MKDILNILRLNLKVILRHKTCIILLLVFIALLTVTAAFAADFLMSDGGIGPISIAVVDLDGDFVTRMIVTAVVEQMGTGDLLYFTLRHPSEANVALADGSVAAIITLPENFGAAMISGENIPFLVQYNQSRPFTSALVQTAADSFADMLRSAQMGVYTVLNYARTQGVSGDDFDRLLMAVNMRYIELVINRADMFSTETLYITGALPIWQTYFFAAYIVLMMCAAFTLTDAIRRNFTRNFIIRLSLRNVPFRTLILACVLSYFLLLALLNIGLFALYVPLGLIVELPAITLGASHLLGITVIFALMAAFATLLTFAFDTTLSAGIFTALFSIISLFLSGGIIPMAFLSTSLQIASNAVPNTWGIRLLTAAELGGNILIPALGCFAFALLFASLCAVKWKATLKELRCYKR